MAWNGWGDAARKPELQPGARSFLESVIGRFDSLTPSVALGEVRVSPSALSEGQRSELVSIVGEGYVLTDHDSRVLHAGGKSYPDIARRRLGDAQDAPDAIVLPGDAEQIAEVLAFAERAQLAVVTFGGGTSVVGGVEPLKGELSGVMSLDLRRMDALVALDVTNQLVRLQPGLRGPAAEALLNAEGYTLGHFPQSYEHASIGGYAATRSAGQASSGYGRSDEMITGLTMVTPRGRWQLGTGTRNAAGPDLLSLAIGSEGTLGVISEVTMRVHPVPRTAEYEGWFAASFADGIEAFRVLEHAGCAPDVTRLSDVEETETSLLLAGLSDSVRSLLLKYLGMRGVRTPCLAIVGWLGDPDEVAARRKRARTVLKAQGLISGGARFGRGWEHGRYNGPYLRDSLMDVGVMVETLETATTWSNLDRVHGEVAAALKASLNAQGTPAHVMCHVSHLYPGGASLYFTFLARAVAGDLVAQWRLAKTAACEAIVRCGATITHHHAVGTDHRGHLEPEIGAVGVAVLRAVKRELDPAGILNPGKLIP